MTVLAAHQARLMATEREARRLLDLSANDLAERLGIRAGPHIRGVETGKRPLTLLWLHRLADGLDLNVGQLWRGELRWAQEEPPVAPRVTKHGRKTKAESWRRLRKRTA